MPATGIYKERIICSNCGNDTFTITAVTTDTPGYLYQVDYDTVCSKCNSSGRTRAK